MENSLDTKLTVRFKGTDGVSYEVLDSFLATICKEVHKYESDELKAYLDFLANNKVDKVTQDAIVYRFGKIDKHRAVTVVGARTGSIEITLSLAAIAYWVVDKTLGETLKEAWLTSELHFNLLDFLRVRISERKSQLDTRIDPFFLRRVDGVEIDIDKTEDQVIFEVTTLPKAAPIPGVEKILTR